uniref:Uncharacterized protein n=1 Tax=Oryza sativa subsp. indica TaxID=39946 RepID=A0A679B8T3_ORYSI|nr:hypothetical protein [Oryza sativa Indica Group]BBD82304.1 hypothetical protein [Oryza sativa Indica Group]
MAELVVRYGASSARGLIKMIMAAVQTAKRNKKQCRELEERVRMVSAVLSRHRRHDQPEPSTTTMAARGLPPGAREAVDGLDGVLREAHELAVAFSQSGGGGGKKTMRRRLVCWARRVAGARRDAERLAGVLSKIDFYLSLYPAIAHADTACRQDRLLWTTTVNVVVSAAVAFAGFVVVSISMVSRKK